VISIAPEGWTVGRELNINIDRNSCCLYRSLLSICLFLWLSCNICIIYSKILSDDDILRWSVWQNKWQHLRNSSIILLNYVIAYVLLIPEIYDCHISSLLVILLSDRKNNSFDGSFSPDSDNIWLFVYFCGCHVIFV
jgi:hypothetical protein